MRKSFIPVIIVAVVLSAVLASSFIATDDQPQSEIRTAFGETTYSITGTVVDSGSQGLEGAHITLKQIETVVKETNSISGGSFSLAEVDAGNYTLIIDFDGYEQKSQDVEVSDADVPLGTITLTEIDITGTVKHNGTAISGASVTLTMGATERTATSLTDGTFSIPKVKTGTYTITVKADGFVTYTNSVEVTESKSITVEMSPVQITGFVKYNDTAISGASVNLTLGPTQTSAVTETDGKFTLSAKAGSYLLTITASGYYQYTQIVNVADSNINLGTMTLSPVVKVDVNGIVTNGSDPIEGATVSFTLGTTQTSAVTETDGKFTLSAKAGSYLLTITASGYYQYTQTVIVTDKEITLDTIILKPIVNVNITGVVKYDGAPISGAAISFTLGSQPVETITGTDGTFLVSASAGEYLLTITATGYYQHSQIVNVADKNINLETILLEHVVSVSVTGTITDEKEVIKDADVSLLIDGKVKVSGKTDANGNFSIKADPETYLIKITAYGYNDYSGTVIIKDSDIDLGTVVLTKKVTGAIVSGVIKSSTTLIEGASILFKTGSEEEPTAKSIITDENGAYSIELIAGSYQMEISAYGYQTKVVQILVEDEDVEQTTVLTPKTGVSGSTIIGYLETTDSFKRFAGSSVNIEIYYRTTENNSSSIDDYKLISSTSTINTDTGTFKITGVKYLDGGLYETVVDRCYLMISIDTYSVLSASNSCLYGKLTFTDESGVITTFYQLNKELSTTETFDDGVEYTVGGAHTPIAVLEPAKGTVSGKLYKDGTVQITDSEGNLLGQGATDSTGHYEFISDVGKNLTITFYAVGYIHLSKTITVYDQNVAPLKNVQDDVTLTPIGDNKAILKIYIDTRSGDISEVKINKITMYRLDNPTETDPTKQVYTEIGSSNTLIKDESEGKINGYYFSLALQEALCTNSYLHIDIDGYAVQMVQSEYMEKDKSLITSKNLPANKLKAAVSTDAGIFKSGCEYNIGTGSSDAIIIDTSTGTIKGDVFTNTENSTALNGVKVSIIDKETGTTVAYGITSNKGNYSITVNTGDYKIRYEIDGYVSYESTVTVYDESIYGSEKNVQPTVKLDEEKGEWFGMDLPHALLVLGGIIAVILIIAALYHRFRVLGKKKDSMYEDDDDNQR